ncbi:auxin efflux carrier [Striga asiatica]|uniref:Auxin efflux carrier n=1 Tax=Striga asiatica TaxID=4170 RepID=A0A5A7QX22_STRAF|nr:auxin efflux carrier [Striga asiatica]
MGARRGLARQSTKDRKIAPLLATKSRRRETLGIRRVAANEPLFLSQPHPVEETSLSSAFPHSGLHRERSHQRSISEPAATVRLAKKVTEPARFRPSQRLSEFRERALPSDVERSQQGEFHPPTGNGTNPRPSAMAETSGFQPRPRPATNKQASVYGGQAAALPSRVRGRRWEFLLPLSFIFLRRLHGGGPNSRLLLIPRPSNLTNVEIFSLHSSRKPSPRGPLFNEAVIMVTRFMADYGDTTEETRCIPGLGLMEAGGGRWSRDLDQSKIALLLAPKSRRREALGFRRVAANEPLFLSQPHPVEETSLSSVFPHPGLHRERSHRRSISEPAATVRLAKTVTEPAIFRPSQRLSEFRERALPSDVERFQRGEFRPPTGNGTNV